MPVGTAAVMDLGQAEFWQRVALEAIVNDDPAKALALRLTRLFGDEITVRPRQRDTCSIEGFTADELEDARPAHFEFDYEITKQTRASGTPYLLAREIDYTAFDGEYDVTDGGEPSC